MVKRIRKRTEKNANTPETDPDSIGHEDGSSSLRNELAQLGEDGFTRQLASGMAWMAENGVMLSVVAVLVFGGFVGIEALEGKADADVAEAAAAFQAAADTYSEAKAEAKEGRQRHLPPTSRAQLRRLPGILPIPAKFMAKAASRRSPG